MTRGDVTFERTMNRAAAIHAAHVISSMTPETVGDEGALADQFEAAGLDSLAAHGLDIRTLPDVAIPKGKP